MRVATWSETHRLDIVQQPDPEPAAGQSLVRINACGICGTDLHLYSGHLRAPEAWVPGHEMAGVVVSDPVLAAGTPVAIEPLVACRECAPCAGGNPQLCKSSKLIGISAPGGLAELLAVRSANVFPLPDGIDPLLGSLAEPLAVALRGVHLAEQPVGATALVLGAGTIGLMSLLLLRQTCAAVAITARYPQQRELALALGAAAVFEPGSKDLREWSKAHAPDAVIETVGGEADTLAEAIYSVRPGGTVVSLGVFSSRPPIPAFRLVNEEIRLVGSVMYGRWDNLSEFGTAVGLLGGLREDLQRFQSATYPLEQVNDAFEAAMDKRRGTLKVAILPSS